MAKESSVERIIGKVPEKEKEIIFLQMKECFDDQKIGELEGKEREKTEEEKQALEFINGATNKLLEKYGLPPFDVPEKNVHVVKENDWDLPRIAYFFPNRQCAHIKEVPNLFLFTRLAHHEIIHFKSHGALQRKTDAASRKNIDLYRMGLMVGERSGSRNYFGNLNEAVTEELNRRFVAETRKNPPAFLREEAAETKALLREHPEEAEEIVYLSEENGKLMGAKFSYPEERLILNTLIDKLYAKNEDKYDNREEVFDVFAKAMFTGNLLPLGRLIDKTFGKGTFRKIGELDENVEELKNFTEEL